MLREGVDIDRLLRGHFQKKKKGGNSFLVLRYWNRGVKGDRSKKGVNICVVIHPFSGGEGAFFCLLAGGFS